MKHSCKGPLTENEPLSPHVGSTNAEAFYNLRDAAEVLGLRYHQLQRTTRSGTFPSYRVNGRIVVRLSEIVAVIERSRTGGAAS